MEVRPTNSSAAIALNLIPGFGPRSFRRAVDRFSDLREVFTASEAALAECGVNRPVVPHLRRADPETLAAEETDRASRCGTRLVSWFDQGYPLMLRHIDDPPPVLYLKGPLNLQTRTAVAVVGSRHPTPYGVSVAEGIGRDLASCGVNVVSGLAAGIDTAAHRGALGQEGATTAVFGSGLDQIYPSQNRVLAEEIAGRGALVSEFPLGTRPERFTFPRRNRVISGLSLATVVVEAGERSGALITADFALEQGREVFAVPGPVGSRQSVGCHRLIRDGAHLYQDIDSLLQELTPSAGVDADVRKASEPAPPGLSEDDRTVFDCLGPMALFLDEIIARTGLSSSRTAASLLSLELRGLARRFPGQRYVRAEGGM